MSLQLCPLLTALMTLTLILVSQQCQKDETQNCIFMLYMLMITFISVHRVMLLVIFSSLFWIIINKPYLALLTSLYDRGQIWVMYALEKMKWNVVLPPFQWSLNFVWMLLSNGFPWTAFLTNTSRQCHVK